MARLEELTPGAFIKGLLPDRLVTVVNAKWYGSTGVELTFKDAAGRPGSLLLYRDREPALEIVSALRPWSFDADGEVLRLVSEAYRIHFAYSVDSQATDLAAASSAQECGAVPAILSPGFVKEQLILQERALAREAAGTAREQETWGTSEEARSRGVETFFVEAINLLDGQISLREPGRYEITQLPASLADLGRSSSFNKQDIKRYNYFTFDADKASLPNKPAAELILPGHPLIKATVQLVLEHYQSVLRQGAILIDPGDDGEELRALFYLEHLVEEVGDSAGLNAVISRQLQCVSIDAHGRVQMAGKAPYLNYQPPSEEDLASVGALRDEPWICAGLEDKVLEFAVSEIVPRHLEQVRHRQKELTARAMAAVRNKVREEIKARKDAVGQIDSPGPAASPSMDEFESQLQQHMQDLEEKRQIFPLSPVAIGGALVIPAGLLAQLKTWYPGDRKEIIAGAGPENADLENAARPPQASVPQDDIEQLMPQIGVPEQKKTADQNEPLMPLGKDSGTEIQWGEIIEHIQHEEERETGERQEDLQEPLPTQEYQGSDGSALFSLVPDLVPAQESGTEQSGRETAGVRPYGLGKKHFTGIPVDLQEEWQAHVQRLQELDIEIPRDVPLIKRNDMDGGLAVWVPSGKFQMGAKTGNKDEKPVHSVQLDGFYLDICLVTNAQYAKFVQAAGLQDWKPPAGYADHPVVGVNWGNARAYCDWVGKRLPTEAEWEKGARGLDNRDYPWGKDYEIGNANALRAGYTSTSPVGIFPSGESPYGALDMAGNVWEWVADWYEATYYLRGNSSNPEGPDRGEHRVVRGGSWICHANYLRCTKRDHHPEAYRSRFIGFRCVH